jgi:pyrimidine operon attenuation protein/uracil phosphoribosyltransferase
VAERERTVAPGAAVFVARTQVMSADDLRRAVTRIAHEIVERNHGLEGVALVALQTGGEPLAKKIAAELSRIEGTAVPTGTLDVVPYRDDYGIRPFLAEAPTDIPFDVTDKTIVLVDDVLFTGRTVRAALNALADFGRAKCVQLAVMVDRGHREVPIRPDFVGKNLPTRRDELVDVRDDGVDIGEMQAK